MILEYKPIQRTRQSLRSVPRSKYSETMNIRLMLNRKARKPG